MAYKVEHNWREPREKLLEILKEIRLCPKNRGICQQILYKSTTTGPLNLFMSYAKQWELAIEGAFIIPSPDITLNALEMYMKARDEDTLWDVTTQYGIWRWELLDFVIAKLMEDLE